MFLDKLKQYFRLRDAVEPIKPEYSSPRNEYYGRVSERFSTAQMILYVVLTIFVLVSLMINSEWITYENFYYFFSDMGDYITSSDSEIEDIIYNVDRKQSFSVYGGKFAVAGNSGMQLYTSSGRLIIDDTDEISNPKLVASDRYLMMYDQGNTEFRMYNIFTETFSANTDFSIYGADVSDSGNFAVITADDRYTSAVHLYNNKFKLQKTYKRNDYVIDVSLNASGNRMAILSYSANGGDMVTNIWLARTNEESAYKEIAIGGALPLYCEFTSTGRLVVVCDSGIFSFYESGDKISDIKLNGEILCADVNEFGAAVASKSDSGYDLSVLDKNGNEIYSDVLTGIVEDIVLYENSVFIDQDLKIIKLDIQSGVISEIDNTDFGAVMLAKNENELLLCLPARVKLVNFD